MRYKPIGYRQMMDYRFFVVEETDDDHLPKSSKPEHKHSPYEKGQILVVEVTGLPMEVATSVKPGRIGVHGKTFELLTDAIEFSNEISGTSPPPGSRREKAYHIRKKEKKFRHNA